MAVNYAIATGALIYTSFDSSINFSIPPSPLIGSSSGTSNGDAAGLFANPSTGYSPTTLPDLGHSDAGMMYIGIDFGVNFDFFALPGNRAWIDIRLSTGASFTGHLGNDPRLLIYSAGATGQSSGLFTGITYYPNNTAPVPGSFKLTGFGADTGLGNISNSPVVTQSQGRYLVLALAYENVETQTGTVQVTELFIGKHADFTADGVAWASYTAPCTSITSADNAYGDILTPFSYNITANGTVTLYSASGLPAWASLNTATGAITGNPNSVANTTVTIGATCNGVVSPSKTLTIKVSDGSPIITSVTADTTTEGVFYVYSITATNLPTSFGATGLPSYLILDPYTGIIAGTPVNITVNPTVVSINISATNAIGTGNDTLTLTIASAHPFVSSALTQNAIYKQFLTYTITAPNSPTSYTATNVPSWLNFNPVTGVLSGIANTPNPKPANSTAHDDFTITIGAINAFGTGTATLVISVYYANARILYNESDQAPRTNPLVDVGSGDRIVEWDPTASQPNTWQSPFDHTPTAVWQDGVHQYTSQPSISDVNNNPGSYYHDPGNGSPGDGTVYIHPIGASPDPHIIMVEFNQFFCAGGLQAPVKFNGNDYLPYLAPDGIPKLKSSLQDPFFGGVTSSAGDISFMNLNGFFDTLAARLRWEARVCSLRIGVGSGAFSSFPVMNNAVCYSTRWSEERFSLATKSQVEQLQISYPCVGNPHTLTYTAQGLLSSSDITASYTFSHELVSSINPSGGSVVQYNRLLKDRPPYARSPLDVDTNAIANAPLGAVKPILYGTCYGVSGIVLASSTTERMVMVAQHAIQQVYDAVNSAGGRASQSYHTHHGSSDVTWSDGIFQGEVRIDLENAVIHEVYLQDNHDIQEAPYVTAPWFINPNDGPYLYDLMGVENSDGTSMANPSDVIKDVFSKAGVTLSPNTTQFDAAGVESDLYNVSLQITSTSTSAIAAVTDLLRAVGGYIYVDSDQQIVFTIPPPTMTPVLTLIEPTGDFYQISSQTDFKQVSTSISTSYPAPVYGGSGVVAAAVPLVEAIGLKLLASTQSLSVPLSDTGSATLSATNMLRRRMKPQSMVTVQTGLKVIGLNLTDPVKLVKTRIPANALPYLIGRVTSIELDFNTQKHTIIIDDMKTVLETPSQAFLAPDDVDLAWSAATDLQRLTIGFWTDDNGYIDTATLSTFRNSLYY